MKLKITLKDPDGVWDGIQTAAQESLKQVTGFSEKEMEQIAEIRRGRLVSACSQWIDCGEYVTIEIDTDAKTATVCPA